MAANNESPFRKKNVLNFLSSTEQDCLKNALCYKDLQFDYMIKLEKDILFQCMDNFHGMWPLVRESLMKLTSTPITMLNITKICNFD